MHARATDYTIEQQYQHLRLLTPIRGCLLFVRARLTLNESISESVCDTVADMYSVCSLLQLLFHTYSPGDLKQLHSIYPALI